MWHIKNVGTKKWTAEATIKLRNAATAVAFSSVDSDHRYVFFSFLVNVAVS